MLKPKNLLRLAVIMACLGFGLRALFSDLPLRSLVWDEQWWGWCAHLAGMTWKEWVTSAAVDAGIETAKLLVGILMLMIAGIVALLKHNSRGVKGALWIAFYILLIQHFLNWKEHFWQLGQLLELTILTATPLLYLYVGDKLSLSPMTTFRLIPGEVRLLTCLVAFTFIGHGFYAAGVHPVPASFVMMTQAGLGVGESTARELLFVVGVLDFIAAFLLLVPRKRAMRIALCWIIPWAVLTTLARWWSYQGIVERETLLTQWLPEVVIRLPHILVPLVLWSWARPQVQKKG